MGEGTSVDKVRRGALFFGSRIFFVPQGCSLLIKRFHFPTMAPHKKGICSWNNAKLPPKQNDGCLFPRPTAPLLHAVSISPLTLVHITTVRAKMRACHPLSAPLPLPTWSRQRWVQRAWTRFCKASLRIIKAFQSPMMVPPFSNLFTWTMQLPRYWWILPRYKMMKSVMELLVLPCYVENYCE